MRSFALVALALVLICSSRAIAQPASDTIYIEGTKAMCGGVPIYFGERLPDIAYVKNGRMYIDAPRFGNLPGLLRLFIFAHECAHTRPNVGGNEMGADCWATKVGRDQGWFTDETFRQVIALLGNSPGDWTHLPGTARMKHIQACYLNP